MAKTVSGPFRVQIKAQSSGSVPPAFASIDDFALEGIWHPNTFIDPQRGPASGGNFVALGKHSNIQYCPFNQKVMGLGADGWHPWNNTGGSGANRFPGFTFNGDGSAMTYFDWYPYFGKAGQPYPIGMDVVPWVWDGNRNCFWMFGGYYSESPPGRNDVGISTAVRHTIVRYFPATEIWEFTGVVAAQPPGESMSGAHVPALDKVFWFTQGGSENGVLEWFDCSNPATQGRFTIGIKPGQNPSSTLPGVNQSSDPNDRIDQRPLLYDADRNELIWTCYKSNYAGVYASSLNNFPANTTTRQVYRGFESGTSAGAQSPMIKRNRKLYISGCPIGSASTDGSGNAGIGFIEIDIDSGERRDAPQPYFLTKAETTPSSEGGRSDCPWPVHGYNEGTYTAAHDRIVATSQVGDPAFFRWSAPSWTPAAGNVKALRTDIFGNAVNSIATPGVLGLTSQSDPAQPWAWGTNGAIIQAWAGGAYARNMSTNGCLLIHNGGDGDYWGNEIYAFDFDTRKWYRVSNPSAAMTGGPRGITTDPGLATNNAKYFNTAECEHGPLVAPTGACSNGDWGLLPQGTQPGVPHTYAGLQWVPGKLIGNRRGALVRPVSTYVYGTRSTTRAHYFDLDRLNRTYYNGQQWGRLSRNRIDIGGANPATTAVDEGMGRIYHNYGYLDLNTKLQVSKGWGRLPHDGSSCFDAIRRIWVCVGAGTLRQPGSLWARRVDFEEAEFNPTFTGDQVWDGGQGQYGGIEYCPKLDCFFFYNVNGQGDVTPTPQVIWKITAPKTNFKTSAWSVQRITMGGDTVALAPGVRGTYGRLRWIPPLKCLAFYHGGPVYLYKPQGL